MKYATRVKVNPSDDDVVGQTLKDAEDVAKILSEFVDTEIKAHFSKVNTQQVCFFANIVSQF